MTLPTKRGKTRQHVFSNESNSPTYEVQTVGNKLFQGRKKGDGGGPMDPKELGNYVKESYDWILIDLLFFRAVLGSQQN